jgi:hypothetical protein
MSSTHEHATGKEVIDLRQVKEWQRPPKVSFDKMASLKIAEKILGLFACVYLGCFVLILGSFWLDGVDFDKSSELVRFMLQSILPLVTLAVGYYLGDRSKQRGATA